MDETEHIPETAPPKPVRLPRLRWMAAIAGATLAAGIVIGAAIGPAPATSLAGDVPGLARQLPLLIAELEARHNAQTATTAASSTPSPASGESPPAPSTSEAAKPAASSPTPASEPAPSETKKETKTGNATEKLPAVTNVWLIQLNGSGFEQAIAEKTATPYINGTLLPAGTLLKGWSAIAANAFAAQAALAEPPATGAVPPIMHSIVQPPCPEGAAGAACAPETPGQLTAADEFLKATLASITGLSTYEEHGLIVVTFAGVGIATQSELPAGAATSTLAYQPPAGVVLLSPFVKAGATSSATFNTTSPRRSLEKLLH